MPEKLDRHFYSRCTVKVAQDLIGKNLVFGKHEGIIIETEAYKGYEDPASHAFKGLTQRSSIMFGQAGVIYIYMIYGVYFCLNIVTEETGKAGAVLIRGLKLPNLNINGPGKLCRHFEITKQHNGTDLTTSSFAYLTEGITPRGINTTKRIGITKAIDKLWRFSIDLK